MHQVTFHHAGQGWLFRNRSGMDIKANRHLNLILVLVEVRVHVDSFVLVLLHELQQGC